MRIRRSPLLAAACALAGACEREPVKWEKSPLPIESAALRPAGDRWSLGVDPKRGPVPLTRYTPNVPEAQSACPGSLMATVPMRREWFAGWFVARPDSSVVLMVARSDTFGATWQPAVVADARDRGRRGCDRPPPAIGLDTVTGFVHLAYFLEPAEGAGVWLVHSMEHGSMWHSPVAVAFGADPAGADVAADRDTVAVAYESPNANEGWIGLALSSTDGHLIDWRIPEVSGRSVPVAAPRVALFHRIVTVAWVTQRGAIVMFRLGLLQ